MEIYQFRQVTEYVIQRLVVAVSEVKVGESGGEEGEGIVVAHREGEVGEKRGEGGGGEAGEEARVFWESDAANRIGKETLVCFCV